MLALFPDDANCRRVRLMTAHMSKGETFYAVYIIQPSLFPLDRVVGQGGIGLEQEPRVEYVALTRSCHTLLYLRNCSLGADSDMETVYYER